MSSYVVGEKKEVFGRELWKGLIGTFSVYLPESISFSVAMYTERSVQRDLYKETSQIRLENMISSL